MNDIKYVISFADLNEKTFTLAGGKGGALARLYQRNYPVPNGFVILATAFKADKLQPEAWTQAQLLIQEFRTKNAHISFAVRSSALAEDSASAAFAGQFETVLSVKTNNQIYDAIHTVYQSKSSERVVSYSERKGIDFQHEIAVIIQELIHAKVSGVLFTADPITGSINSMSGSFVHGLGDQLVSGESDALEFRFQRPKGTFSGPEEFKPFAKHLYSLAKQVEKDLGAPQDIEWAVSQGKVYILQSRPITTLLGYDPKTAYWNESLRGDYFWAFAGVGEILPEILYPSEWSLWDIYNNEVMEHEWFLPHKLYANIAGRIYSNGSVMVSAMKRFRYSDDRIRDIFSEALGVIPPEVIIPTFHVSYGTILTKIIPDEFKWQLKVRRLKKKIPEFLENFKGNCQEIKTKIKEQSDKAELAHLWTNELKPLYHEAIWMIKVANEVFYNPYNNLSIELGKIVGKEFSNILIQGIPKDITKLESLGPLIGLREILEGKMTHDKYLDRYGHRDPFENYLRYSRPAEEPKWLEKQLKNYSPLNYDQILQNRIQEFEEATKKLQEEVKPKKVKNYLQKIQTLLEEMHIREDIRSELTRSIWMIRFFYIQAGKLTGLGSEIFLLTIEELLGILLGTDTSALEYLNSRKEFYQKLEALPPYPSLINGRFDPFEWNADPNHRSDLFDSHIIIGKEVEKDPDIITGLPGSSGKIEGVVRIIRDPKEGDKFQLGEILVTRTTNVGWTPLFGRAGAIITDVGSPLAHAAIVARELRIPAVVGCGDATLRLNSGDKVRLDGGQGIIKIIQRV